MCRQTVRGHKSSATMRRLSRFFRTFLRHHFGHADLNSTTCYSRRRTGIATANFARANTFKPSLWRGPGGSYFALKDPTTDAEGQPVRAAPVIIVTTRASSRGAIAQGHPSSFYCAENSPQARRFLQSSHGRPIAGLRDDDFWTVSRNGCRTMALWCPGAESNHRHRDFQSPFRMALISAA